MIQFISPLFSMTSLRFPIFHSLSPRIFPNNFILISQNRAVHRGHTKRSSRQVVFGSQFFPIGGFPATNRKSKAKVFPERVFLYTCDEHLFCARFLWNTARDTTSLSRQTKKHWLKIRNAQCFPAFAPCTIPTVFTTFNIFQRSNHTSKWTAIKNIRIAACVGVRCWCSLPASWHKHKTTSELKWNEIFETLKIS